MITSIIIIIACYTYLLSLNSSARFGARDWLTYLTEKSQLLVQYIQYAVVPYSSGWSE